MKLHNISTIMKSKKFTIIFASFTMVVSITIPVVILFSKYENSEIRDIAFETTVNIYNLDESNNRAELMESKTESSRYIYISDFFEHSPIWDITLNGGMAKEIYLENDPKIGIFSKDTKYLQLASPTSKKQCSSTTNNPIISNTSSKYCTNGFSALGFNDEFKIENNNDILDIYLTDWSIIK